MPTIGSFHAKYWRRVAAGAPPPGGASSRGYSAWQASVITGSLFGALQPLWEHLSWYAALARQLWTFRAPAARAELEAWITQRQAGPIPQPPMPTPQSPQIVVRTVERLVENPVRADRWKRAAVTAWRDLKAARSAESRVWADRYEAADPEQRAVLDRVLRALERDEWPAARERVRVCATTPKFHHADQWVEYSRAIKADVGQAQNVFRHIKVVHELRAAHPALSNADAHLLAELAYHGFAAQGRPERRIVDHPKRIIPHAVQQVTH